MYKMVSAGADYRDLGEACLDQLDHKHTARNLVRRLERHGYAVHLQFPPLPPEAVPL